jgi:hypothetical protein
LDGAICPEISLAHRHYVACPVVEGVQPCLIEVNQPNGKTSIDDALIVLPTDAPHFLRDVGQPQLRHRLT